MAFLFPYINIHMLSILDTLKDRQGGKKIC